MDTKSLSQADLGIKPSSNVSHIGLTETMISLEGLSSEDKKYNALLFIEGKQHPHHTYAYINAIKSENNTYRSPKLKTGGRGVSDDESLLRLIRKKAIKDGEVIYQKLSLGSATDQVIAYLHNCDTVNPTQSELFNDYSNTETAIYKDNVIKVFCKEVIVHLLAHHELKFKSLLSKNATSAEHLDLDSLTRIILTSNHTLDRKDLSTNGRPRYFEDPINNEVPLWYLSGEWYGNETDKLLCFKKLTKVIENHFPQYYLKQEKDTYYFIGKKLITSVNYELPPALDIPLLPNTCTSLLTKPFTILTGSSGTGKTKIAESLAEHYSNASGDNSEIVAVGADWTDSRSTLGFVNHLQKDQSDQPIYQSSKILNLMLRANENPGFPYFLILDEMNLSHVERYFADFLSAMEQKDGEFHLHDEGDELQNSASGYATVPDKLRYPPNLFVIGTVNIDETTYMFSPKVLDRANVIEFKVDPSEMEDFLANPGCYPAIDQAAEGQAEAFLAKAKAAKDDTFSPLSKSVSAKLNPELMQLFHMMQMNRFEFAYRTANEINRYMRVCYDLANDQSSWTSEGWETNFDEQIVQKILPKLHGSIGRVGKLIAQLAHFCHTPMADKPNYSDSLQAVSELNVDGAKYKKSFAKLQAMAATLREEQFVSFIH